MYSVIETQDCVIEPSSTLVSKSGRVHLSPDINSGVNWAHLMPTDQAHDPGCYSDHSVDSSSIVKITKDRTWSLYFNQRWACSEISYSNRIISNLGRLRAQTRLPVSSGQWAWFKIITSIQMREYPEFGLQYGLIETNLKSRDQFRLSCSGAVFPGAFENAILVRQTLLPPPVVVIRHFRVQGIEFHQKHIGRGFGFSNFFCQNAIKNAHRRISKLQRLQLRMLERNTHQYRPEFGPDCYVNDVSRKIISYKSFLS